MQKTILKIMLKDHLTIDSLLKLFIKQVENDFNDYKQVMQKFNRFKWNLEKHFFIEEKIIFTIYSSSNPENEDLLNLLKDHKNILWIINRIEEDLENKTKPKLMSLSETLRKHASFENEVFYPKLEDELSGDEKKLILDRSEEVVR